MFNSKAADERWIYGMQFSPLQYQYFHRILEQSAETVRIASQWMNTDNESHDLNTNTLCSL
jgi:hypothetical protein